MVIYISQTLTLHYYFPNGKACILKCSRFYDIMNLIQILSRDSMTFSYKRLWKLLIDMDMKKKDLCNIAGVSTATLRNL